MSPILKWPGGKYYLKNKIIPIMENQFCYCRTYVEVFCGGLSILLNKSPLPTEVINDLDEDVYNFYIQIKTNFEQFCWFLDEYNYDQRSFNLVADYEDDEMGPERAVKFFIRNRMSVHGIGKIFSKTELMSGGLSQFTSQWVTIYRNMDWYHERLKNVTIKNEHFRDILQEYNQRNVLIYLDPPYLPETRSTENIYSVEMTPEEHREMIQLAKESKARIIISHYSHRLYNEQLSSWQYIPIEIANRGRVKNQSKRVEGLWVSP